MHRETIRKPYNKNEMENKTKKYFVPEHGVYMYARTHSGKRELIVLNSTDEEQTVARHHYHRMVEDTHIGKEVGTGREIDLRDQMTVGARQSLVIEL